VMKVTWMCEDRRRWPSTVDGIMIRSSKAMESWNRILHQNLMKWNPSNGFRGKKFKKCQKKLLKKVKNKKKIAIDDTFLKTGNQ